MGFNYFNYGNIHPCGISKHKVFYTLPSGFKVEYDTKLDIEIPEQTSAFISSTIAFVLYHEDKMYIGRRDKSISIYRMSDELLVGLNTWDPVNYTETKPIGHFNNGRNISEIHVDLRDSQTVYICGEATEGVLPKKYNALTDFDLEKSAFSAAVWGNNKNYHIFSKRGEPIEVNVWIIQKNVREQNCRVFL